MGKNFGIEFWIKDEAIDQQDYDSMPYIPSVGERIFLTAKNDSVNSEYGEYFQVTKRNILFWGNKQKVMIWLAPISKEAFYA